MPPDPPRRDPSDLPTLGQDYFDRLYGHASDGDPWNFARSAYEAAKYTATLARLPRERYAVALEVGCSIGVFTRRLAARVDDLLAIDIAPAALDQARSRCADLPHCRFARASPLDSVPGGPFDLIIVAEVAYYWTPADFTQVWRALTGKLVPGGQILLVHWRGPVPDYPQSGDQVHRLAHDLAGSLGLEHRGEWVDDQYRTDLWEIPRFPVRPAADRSDPESVRGDG